MSLLLLVITVLSDGHSETAVTVREGNFVK